MEKLLTKPSAPQKQKIFFIEILRIFACFAVILLHSTGDVMSNTSLYGTRTWDLVNFINASTRFAVPIFFMISGYLAFSSTKEHDIKTFLKQKVVRSLLPLFIYSFLYYLFTNKGAKISVLDFLFRFVSMDVHYHLWFMYTLIGLELLVPVLKKSVQNLDNKMLWYFFLIAIFPTTIGPFINKLFNIWLFRFEPLILGYFGYFLLGYILGKTEFSKNKRILIYLNGALWILIGYFGNKLLSSNEAIDVFFNGGYQINSYFIASALFIFAKYNFKEFKKDFINSLILNISKLTFDIYLIHAFVLTNIQSIPNSGHIINLVLLSIPTFIVSLIIAFVIDKLKQFIKNKLILKIWTKN